MSVKISGSSSIPGDLGSIDNAARAATAALTDARLSPADVSTVINCGVFRDNNLAEPAICALIQQRAGIGMDYQPGHRPTFGFDLHNGPCGPLDAVAVAQAMFATDPDHGAVLIVSGDAHPGQHAGEADPDFPYPSVGGAWVLTRHDGPDGFSAPQFLATDSAVSPTAYVDMATIGAHGRSALTLTSGRTAGIDDAIVEMARKAFQHNDVDASTVTAVISADTSLSTSALVDALGVRSAVLSNAHSSGVMDAYRSTGERTDPLGPILFVAAAPGPSAAAVFYRHPA